MVGLVNSCTQVVSEKSTKNPNLCLKYRSLTKIGPGDTELDEVK